VTPRRTRSQPQDPTTSRRPGSIPGRRFALALALAWLATPGGIAAADQSTSPIVVATVYKPGGGVTSDAVSLGTLQGNPQQCPPYSRQTMTEYRSQGAITVGLPQSGPETGTWPLSSILGCLQTPVLTDDVTGLTVVNSNGSPEVSDGSQLVPKDLASPSDFADPAETAVVSDLGSTFQYNRPWRGATDLDYLDEVNTSSPVTIEVYEGPRLTVNVTASATSVSAGSTISFNATVSGANGSPLSYHWSFGNSGADDSTASDPGAQFASAGTYTVTLQVTDSNGGGGGATIPITVTSASETQPQTTPAPTRTGPDTSSGTAPTGNPSTTPQAATKPANPQPKGTHDKQPSTTPAAAPKTQTRSHHRTTTAATTPSGSGPTAGSGASGSSGSATSGSPPASSQTTTGPQSTSHSRAGPRHPPSRPAQSTPGQAPVVDGRLISDVIPISATASPLVHVVSSPTPAVAPERRHIARTSLLPLVTALLTIALLFGLGARRELRGPHAWRALRVSS
jgi:PKD repeat protein